MRRGTAIAGVLVLVLAACGGSDDGSASETTTTTIAESSGGGGETTTTQAAPSGDGAGVGTATLTLEGTTYRFGDNGFPALTCNPDLFGVYFAVLALVETDGAPSDGGIFTITLLREGVDPDEVGQLPEAEVTLDARDEDWIASEEDIAALELDPGSSQIDTYTVDGSSASGSATFYEQNSYFAFVGGVADSVRTAGGTFEVTCYDG